MTNNYLRRLLHSAEASSFIPSGGHNTSTSSYTPPASTSKPACTQVSLMHSSKAPVRASHFSCLPLPARARHCLPLSSSSTILYSSGDEENLITNCDLVDKLEHNHSCSKLPSRKQLIPSFKSLLHSRGPSSQNSHINHGESSGSSTLRGFEAENPTGGSKYTRSWSSPTLHLPRHMVRLPRKSRSLASSRHSSPDHGCSRARYAPKGHVAVYVEAGEERNLVPIAYLSHPLFQALLERAEREYGFRQEGPGLRIPCSLREFQHTLRHIRTQ